MHTGGIFLKRIRRVKTKQIENFVFKTKQLIMYINIATLENIKEYIMEMVFNIYENLN